MAYLLLKILDQIKNILILRNQYNTIFDIPLNNKFISSE